MHMIQIPPTRPGDKIAVIAPASLVDRHYVEGACELLKARGYRPEVYPSALGSLRSGSYSAPVAERVEEFRQAWSDPETTAVMCARGGYGCIHLIPHLDREFITSHPKWLWGFSDVSALEAMLFSYGLGSVHAPMARHMALHGAVDPCTSALFDILEGKQEISYQLPSHPYSRPGIAKGTLLGGNLAVLNSLAGTRYDMLDLARTRDVVLIIEDVSEAIYAVERMVMRMALNGVLDSLKGLIVGRFSDYHADRNFLTVEQMLRHRLAEWNIRPDLPVAYGFPVGHVSDNRPFVQGSEATLEIDGRHTTLTFNTGFSS